MRKRPTRGAKFVRPLVCGGADVELAAFIFALTLGKVLAYHAFFRSRGIIVGRRTGWHELHAALIRAGGGMFSAVLAALVGCMIPILFVIALWIFRAVAWGIAVEHVHRAIPRGPLVATIAVGLLLNLALDLAFLAAFNCSPAIGAFPLWGR